MGCTGSPPSLPRDLHLGVIDCTRLQPNVAARKSIWSANPLTIEEMLAASKSGAKEIGCTNPQHLRYWTVLSNCRTPYDRRAQVDQVVYGERGCSASLDDHHKFTRGRLSNGDSGIAG
jgi:hypothetical protein